MLLASRELIAQSSKNDSIKYFERYKEKITFRTSMGINDAPFNLVYRFATSPHKELKYLPNPQHLIGIGIHYYGFGLSFNFKLPTTIRNERLYGKSKYFDLEMAFQRKKWVLEFSFRRYKGFAISNLPALDPNYKENDPLAINPDLTSWTLSGNVKYFFNKNYDYNSVKGFTGRHLKSTYSFYGMGVLNGFSLKSNDSTFLPQASYNPNFSFSSLDQFWVFEIGAIPGIAAVLAHKLFNLGINLGLGAVLQYHESYRNGDKLGRFLVAPKIDLGLNLGINKPNWFLKLFLTYDWKISNFDAYHYFHNYYRIMLNGGYRLKVKTPKFLKKKIFNPDL